MLGALVGVKKGIPIDMVMKVVNFDCNTVNEDSDRGQIRPDYLSTKKYMLKNIDQLI
jgi:hypothetical protein